MPTRILELCIYRRESDSNVKRHKLCYHITDLKFVVYVHIVTDLPCFPVDKRTNYKTKPFTLLPEDAIKISTISEELVQDERFHLEQEVISRKFHTFLL